jgi:TerC family integral membrane protein
MQAMTSLTLVLTAAAVFDVGIYHLKGPEAALDFVSGFLVEESLSVDNLFVFLLLFDYFKTPSRNQGKVLQYGLWGAVVLRALFIGAGVVALESFRPVLLVFAAVLVASSVKLLLSGGADDDDEDLSENAIVQLAQKLVKSTDEYDGDRFFTKEGVATPLFLVLVCIELSDIVFAVDSVPAVFGVTEDPLIVFASNMFAILGLRSVYSVLADAVEALPYLQQAVAVILAFVGAKLAGEYFGLAVGDAESLIVIGGCLAIGVLTSLLFPPPKSDAE